MSSVATDDDISREAKGHALSEKLAHDSAHSALFHHVPDANLDAEVALLHSAMIDVRVAEMLASPRVPRDAFTGPVRTAIRDALVSLVRHGDEASGDVGAVCSELQDRLPGSLRGRHVYDAVMERPAEPPHAGIFIRKVLEARFKRLSKPLRDKAAQALMDEDYTGHAKVMNEIDALRPSTGFAARFETGCKPADQLLLEEDEELDEVIEGLLARRRILLLVAPAKVGKSLAALGLAVDLVAALVDDGRTADFLGCPIVAKGPVLYLSAEGGDSLLRKRLRWMGANLGKALKNLITYTKQRPDLTNAEDIEAVYSYAKEKGCVAVIWDPLGRFWPVDDDTEPRAGRELMDRMDHWSQEANVATVIVHHDTKSSGLSGTHVSAGRGTGKLMDDVTGGIVNIKVDPKDRRNMTAHFVVRDGPPIEPSRIAVDPETLWIRVVPEEEVEKEKARRSGGRPIEDRRRDIFDVLTKMMGARQKQAHVMDSLGIKDPRTWDRQWPGAVTYAATKGVELVRERGSKTNAWEVLARPAQRKLNETSNAWGPVDRDEGPCPR